MAIGLAILAVVGTLAGVLLTNWANQRREADNRKHQNAVWMRDQRRVAYAAFLTAYDSYLVQRTFDMSVGAPLMRNEYLPLMTTLRSAVSSVALVGPEDVSVQATALGVLVTSESSEFSDKVAEMRKQFVSKAAAALSE